MNYRSIIGCVALLLMQTTLIDARSSKHKAIIAWDLHDVLLEGSGTTRVLWNFPSFYNLITHCSPALIKEMMYLMSNHLFHEVSSQAYVNAARGYDNPYLADFVIALANAQRIKPGMLEIVKELHSLGYEQQILSNVGLYSFQALTNPHQYPQFKELFSYMNLKKSHVVGDDGIRKPHHAFFEAYIKENKLDKKPRTVFFIDDKAANIRAAEQMGFIGICFKDTRQLRTSLQKYDIPVTSLPVEKKTRLQMINSTRFLYRSAIRRIPMNRTGENYCLS